MLRREGHGERLFLSNNKSILFTNMVKWIEINRSGAFYRLPAPLDLLSMNGLFSGMGDGLLIIRGGAGYYYMAQPLSQSCTRNPWHSPAIGDAGKTFH